MTIIAKRNEGIVPVDLSSYGLSEVKAEEIKKDFDAVLNVAIELEESFNLIVSREINPDLCAEAKALRLKYVKVRRAIDEVHKERKAFYLSGGRAVDGLKNAYTHAVTGCESRLAEIEKHYENIEAERVAKCLAERLALAEPLDANAMHMNLGVMAEDVWASYYDSIVTADQARKDKARKEEEDRLAKIEADRIEFERIQKVEKKLKAEIKRNEAELKAKEKEVNDKLKALEIERSKEREESAKAIADQQKETQRILEEQEKEKALQKQIQDQQKQAEAEALAKSKNRDHQRGVNLDAVDALTSECGLSQEDAIKVVKAIALGKISHITINY